MQVTLIDSMGSDERVVNAARVERDKEVLYLQPRDENLISYMAKHGHWTPFAHCVATFHIKAPIFVRAQLAKHTVGLVMNEVSRRYITDEPEFYTPSEWRGASKTRKQGSEGTVELSESDERAIYLLEQDALSLYKKLIEEDGVAPEMARMYLPQNTYTEWYWTGSLAAFARVYNLRVSPDAQHETQLIALGIGDHLKYRFPISWAALTGEYESLEIQGTDQFGKPVHEKINV